MYLLFIILDDNPRKRIPGYGTKLHLLVRLQFSRFEERKIHLHCHFSRVHSDLEWSYLSGSHVWVITVQSFDLGNY